MENYINFYILEYCGILVTFDAVLGRFRELMGVVLRFLYEAPRQKIHCNDFVVRIRSAPLTHPLISLKRVKIRKYR
jgi:hypothetical protein